jgi:cyanophycin synthetase
MKPSEIRFLQFHYLRGPNIWTYRPVLETWVDIGNLEDSPSNTIPGFVERLCAWLPSLSEHRCSYGEPGGFVRRLHEGTWPAHILEHVTLELQNLAGMPGGFGKARETGVRGVYKVVVSAHNEGVTRTCLHAARDLVMAAITDAPFDVEATHGRLREVAEKHLPDPGIACITSAAAAKDRLIPAIHLSAENLVQLGYGALQRRIWSTKTDRTSAIAEGISGDWELTSRLLRSCGLPVFDPDDGDEAPAGDAHRLLVIGDTLIAAIRLDHGGGAHDITGHIHPGIAAAACLAVRIVGLDIAEVNLRAEDVALPLFDQQAVITSVKLLPDLHAYLQATTDEPRPIGQAIVDHLFPAPENSRIPVVGITGSSGGTEVARFVAEFLRLSGKSVGLACGDGLFLDNRWLDRGDCGDWNSGTRVLMNRSVEAAVLENGADTILGQGLAYDRCSVGVITRIESARHFGKFHIERPEQVLQVMRTQVDVVLKNGCAVLNAADPMTAELACLCDGEIILFALDPTLPLLVKHLSEGGRAVIVQGNELIMASGNAETSLIAIPDIPLGSGAMTDQRLENVMAAAAAAWALGIATHVVRTGISTFSTDSTDLTLAGITDPSGL